MSDDGSQAPSSVGNKRKVQHISRACDLCRRRKIRCSGTDPCDVCTQKGVECVYNANDGRRILDQREELERARSRVSALELQLEQEKVRALRRRRSTTASGMSPQALASISLDIEQFIQSNPLIAPLASTNTTYAAPPPVSDQAPSTHQVAPSDKGSDRVQDPLAGISGKLASPAISPHVRHGDVSLWAHEAVDSAACALQIVPAGWNSHLPPNLPITREIHDEAIRHFSAYHGHWYKNIDNAEFANDLQQLSQGSGSTMMVGPFKSYTPLLHCTVLYQGLFLLRHEYPQQFEALQEVFLLHCHPLLLQEFANASLASLRSINMFSIVMNEPPVGSSDTGYTYFGCVASMIQTLGLSTVVDHQLQQGRISPEAMERRRGIYWTAYICDMFRAVSQGRPPLFATANPKVGFPAIDPAADEAGWYSSIPSARSTSGISLGAALDGMPSMSSTIFHWTARLAKILAAALEVLYSVSNGAGSIAIEVVDPISVQLEEWRRDVPLRHPVQLPLPHVLALYMVYHFLQIILFRPFYRITCPPNYLPHPAERCDEAAKSILLLLQLFNQYHGLRSAPATLVFVTSTAATVFLLQASGGDSEGGLRNVEHCRDFLKEMSKLWKEGERVLKVLASLTAQWLPAAPGVPTPQPTTVGPDLNSGTTEVQYNIDDWLSSDGLYNELFLGMGDMRAEA